MTPFSIFLILISAILHSLWNFFSKRGNWPLEFYWWVFLWGSLLYLPFFITLSPFPVFFFHAPPKLWYLSLLSGLIQTLYFTCLIEAYRVGDLSFVYPISRSAPLFTLLWATLFIGEILSLNGVLGIGLVTSGIFITSSRGFHLRRSFSQTEHFLLRPYLLALLAALSGSIYSVIDKVVVQTLHPIHYTWLINLWMCLFVSAYLFSHRRNSFTRVWRDSKREIFTIVFLQNVGYVSFLMALQMSKVSYVVAFRQVAVLFGTLMGVFLLKESHWKTRLVGASILTMGLFLIGLAK